MKPRLRRSGWMAACGLCLGLPAQAGQNIVTGIDVATTGPPSVVKRFDTPSLAQTASFNPFAAFNAGIRVAFNDLTGDGVDDFVLATGQTGLTGPCRVSVWDGAIVNVLFEFLPFGLSGGGSYVAAADFNGNGKADILAGSACCPTTVKVFDGTTLAVLHNFQIPSMAGVRVAAALVNGDGVPDIVAGAETGSPRVMVFDGATLALLHDFLAYPPGFTGGVYVAAGDINSDGRADIITGAGAGSAPQVKAFDGVTSAEIANFLAFAPGFTGGVRVAAGRVNADLVPDIVVGTGPGAAQVRAFDGQTLALLHDFLPYGAVTDGLFVAAPFTQGVVPVGLRDFVIE